MTVTPDIQIATKVAAVPDCASIAVWANAAVMHERDTELTVRIVDKVESAHLNKTYRNKPGATNVLAFPADVPDIAGLSLLGDIVICAPVVVAEAAAQGKSAEAHWAHLIIHGILHLQGLAHENADDAAEMEGLEVDILARLGYSNPYEADHSAAETRGNTFPQ